MNLAKMSLHLLFTVALLLSASSFAGGGEYSSGHLIKRGDVKSTDYIDFLRLSLSEPNRNVSYCSEDNITKKVNSAASAAVHAGAMAAAFVVCAPTMGIPCAVGLLVAGFSLPDRESIYLKAKKDARPICMAEALKINDLYLQQSYINICQELHAQTTVHFKIYANEKEGLSPNSTLPLSLDSKILSWKLKDQEILILQKK